MKTDLVSADNAWLQAYHDVLEGGDVCAPRGKTIKELPQYTVVVSMNQPVVRVKERKLNYKFMAAEALWILQGRNDVAFLSAVNPNIAQFSDDGVTLSGAYGKQIHPQMDYVVNKLLEDRDTRQAVLTLWKPNPSPSKDIPCTIAMDFKIRNDALNCHVFMRSSDLWLGLPYDIFSFSAVAYYIASRFNEQKDQEDKVLIGGLYLTAASSHIYEPHWNMAPLTRPRLGCDAPLWEFAKPDSILADLEDLMATKPGDIRRWWEQ
jgi:thymidylate synthase